MKEEFQRDVQEMIEAGVLVEGVDVALQCEFSLILDT